MSIPANPQLYEFAKEIIKSRVDRWPSAYASGQLVQLYKRMGGKYIGEKNSDLNRWYKEKWVNLAKPIIKGDDMVFEECGESNESDPLYPYCRPTIRVDKNTPETVDELIERIGYQGIANRVRKKQKIKDNRLLI
jgi:hypothetical protein